MLGAAVIVFRETLEAALIIGILAAATAGTPHRAKWLSGGVAAGILGAVMLALGAEQIGEVADGIGQELMNAGILGIAVAMLAWHNIWMSRHGAQLAREAKQLGRDVKSGATDMASVAVVVAMAVLREGSETVLFLYGLIAGSETTVASTLAGTALGIGAGAFAGVALYAGFVRIPARWFFSATSALILLLAAAMAGQMARFLVQADEATHRLALDCRPLRIEPASCRLSASLFIGTATARNGLVRCAFQPPGSGAAGLRLTDVAFRDVNRDGLMDAILTVTQEGGRVPSPAPWFTFALTRRSPTGAFERVPLE